MQSNPKPPASVRVLVLRPDEAPSVESVPNELSAFQALVGGWLEAVQLNKHLYLYCNEEGDPLGLPFNRLLHLASGIVYLVGPAFLTRVNSAGEHVDLTDFELATLLPLITPTDCWLETI